MNLKTFYRIYYRHRILKANHFRKFYIILILPFIYILNLIFLPRKINLDNLAKKKPELFKKDLNFLFEYFNSDKGENYINQYSRPLTFKKKLIKAHGYSKYYELYLKDLKQKKLSIIEIGSFYGNASAALFFYFNCSNIYSADINPDMYRYKSRRLANFYSNTSLEKSITKDIIEKNIKFDVVIEDASHMLKDQIISLFMLFPLLNSKGIFFIEEIDFPETREDMRIGHQGPDLKYILNCVKMNKEFNSTYISDEQKKYFLKNVESIEIKKGNFNEIAIIKKK